MEKKISNKQSNISMIILFVFMIIMATLGKVFGDTWIVFYVVALICIGFPLFVGMVRFWEWLDNKVENQARRHER